MPDYLLDTNIISYWYDSTPDQNGKLKTTHESVILNVGRVLTPDPQTRYIPRLFISVVTLAEMEYGHRCAPNPNPVKQAEYARFVRTNCPVALDMTSHVAEQYGQLKAWLFNNCSPKRPPSKAKRAEQLIFPATGLELLIDENDLWIAAQAMTHNLVLVTHDRRGHLGAVLSQFSTRLTVEDWAV